MLVPVVPVVAGLGDNDRVAERDDCGKGKQMGRVIAVVAGACIVLSLGVCVVLVLARNNREAAGTEADSKGGMKAVVPRQGRRGARDFPAMSDAVSFLGSIDVNRLSPCGSVQCRDLAIEEASAWSRDATLIEVFATSFLVHENKAKSLSWCFVFKRQESSDLLFVLMGAGKVLRVGTQRKISGCEILQHGAIREWTYDPMEVKYHLRSIPMKGGGDISWTTVWIKKLCGQIDTQKKEKTVTLMCEFLDSSTGQIVNDDGPSNEVVAAVHGVESFESNDAPGHASLPVVASDMNRLPTELLVDAKIIRLGDGLTAVTMLCGGSAAHVDENNRQLSEGVLITQFEGDVAVPVYYKNGERASTADYLKWLINLK